MLRGNSAVPLYTLVCQGKGALDFHILGGEARHPEHMFANGFLSVTIIFFLLEQCVRWYSCCFII